MRNLLEERLCRHRKHPQILLLLPFGGALGELRRSATSDRRHVMFATRSRRVDGGRVSGKCSASWRVIVHRVHGGVPFRLYAF
ncbi:hypothetical protein OBBRIDRAFT_587510 [Obba rivulosa]|uniref:Uncharacterized protein n=1 Tax=Obba rivulosa TaxID=1052685 RepID=A0A8E2AZ03_9APHY|nr:hypothetical protein OBBRIDRAFT_587510 [Obba rivulosa]